MFLSVITGLVAIVLALAWFRRRSRREKIAELRKDERIDLFAKEREHSDDTTGPEHQKPGETAAAAKS